MKIELTGPYTAECDGIKVTNRNGPICKLARKLVDKGHSPHTKVTVWMDGVMSFSEARLSWWADRTTAETDRQSVRFAPYVPFPAKAVGHTAQSQG